MWNSEFPATTRVRRGRALPSFLGSFLLSYLSSPLFLPPFLPLFFSFLFLPPGELVSRLYSDATVEQMGHEAPETAEERLEMQEARVSLKKALKIVEDVRQMAL